MASIAGTSLSRELRTRTGRRSFIASLGACSAWTSICKPGRPRPAMEAWPVYRAAPAGAQSFRQRRAPDRCAKARHREERSDVAIQGSCLGLHPSIASHALAMTMVARPPQGGQELSLLPYDISIEPDPSPLVDLAIEALDLRLEPREHVSALLEHLQIVYHRPRPRGQPLPGDDGRDPRRIDHPERGRDAAVELGQRQIVDVVAHQMARGLARRH